MKAIRQILIFVFLSTVLLNSCIPASRGDEMQSGAELATQQADEIQTHERIIHLLYSSTSDLARLVIRNPEQIHDYKIIKSWGDATRLSVIKSGIALEQTQENASASHEIGVLVEYRISSEQFPTNLDILVEKGELNTAHLVFSDVTGPDEYVIEDFEHFTTGTSKYFNRTNLKVVVGSPAPKITQANSDKSNIGGVIFYNGKILTMNPAQAEAQAIFIQDNKITAVGSQSEIMKMAGADTKMIDLGRHTLMPGFIDAHSHSFNNIWREDFETGQRFLLSHGITTTAELFVEEPLIQDFQAFNKSGQLRMRVSLYPVRIDNCGGDRGEWYWPKYPPTMSEGAMLEIPGIKIFSDGGSCNRPARSFPYPDGGFGDLYNNADTLASLIRQAQNHGYQVAIHGLGDRAIKTNLDALEMSLDGGQNTLHHRLEHNTLLSSNMFARFGKIDAVTVIFGYSPTCFFIGEEGQYKYRAPEEFAQMEWAYRALIDANPNVHFAWHSDAPAISPLPEPMKNIYGFLTRRQYKDDGTVCKPPAWLADDILTINEVLPMMTSGAAYAIRREKELGSLEPNKLADMIILSDNPTQVDADSILEIKVLMTMVGGQVQFCLPGNSELCP